MISDKYILEKPIAIGLVITATAIAGIVLSTGVAGPIVNNANQAEAQPAQVNNTIIRVEAGGGNSTDVKTVFVPQKIEIKAGQTINWYNPTPVEEPHSVAFLKDSRLLPLFAVPYGVPTSTEFKALMPGPNVEPLIVPSNDTTTATKTVIVANARSFNPTIIDSTGNNVTYLPPNSSYAMDGTESYINSGWIWPEGQVPLGAPPITGFTVTFEKPGIYDYLCTVHPWMTGSVEVS
jgi:plastocyanin